MTCTVTVSLLGEFVDGDIGDDWQYALSVDVFNPGPAGSARLDVPPHRVKPGVEHELPDGPSATIEAGPCGVPMRIELHLAAAEVDWIFSDTGTSSAAIELRCPGPDEPAVTIDRHVSAYVEERPRIIGGSANFMLRLRVVAECL